MIVEKYRLKAILDIKAVVAKKSPLETTRSCEGRKRVTPSSWGEEPFEESCRRRKREKSSESIESEKKEVND